jgi:uncharacterized protein involved in response to NO
VLLAYAFRPFFLLTGVYGAVAIAGWSGFLFAGWTAPLGPLPVHWHSHELLFGVVPAAIAGFLLTAITNWTGARPLHGVGLAALIALWLAGRVAMWSFGALPPATIAAIDLAFLPVLAAYVLTVLIRHGNRRNWVIGAVLVALAGTNLLMHLGFAGHGWMWARAGELLALNLITLLMVVIAGRITPAFSGNWLRAHGRAPDVVRVSPALERAVVPVTALMIPADLVMGAPWLGAVVAAAAAAVHGMRLWLWRGWHTRAEPLLWILHVAYAWIVVALALKALSPLVGLPATAWVHALATGAIGTLIIGVMTRVAMGHTARPLRLLPYAIVLYAAVLIAAVLRTAAAIGIATPPAVLMVAAAAWALAFGGYAVLYWPVLSRPRADGGPG